MSEKVKVIDIDTGKSAKTLKELKEEIKNLRKALDECEIGSDQFVNTLNELSDAQEELKSATKSTTEAVEGSYDALVKKMAELKKQWKATADEVERSKLGDEISEVNKKLKELDEGIGNYQRNVGNYGSAFDDLSIKFEDGVAKFERMNKVTQDVVGSFDVVEGSLKSMGVESEVVSGCMDKLNGVMQMTRGFESIKEGVVAFRALTTATNAQTVATNGVSVATNGFKKALISTGIGAIVVLVGTLIANLDKLKEALGFASAEQEELNKKIEEQKEKEKERRDAVSSSIATVISKYNLLQGEWKELKDNQEKTDWIRDNADAFSDLGLAITDVASAQDVLINKSSQVIKALTLQAEAAALQEIYQEAYKEAYKRARELDAEMADIKANPITAGYDTDRSFRKKYGLHKAGGFEKYSGDFQMDTKQEYVRSIGDYTTITTESSRLSEQGAKKVQQQREKEVQDQIDVVYAESNSILQDVIAKQEEAAAAEAEISKYVISTKRSTNNAKSSSIDETVNQINAIEERVRQSLIRDRKDELDELKRIYDEEKALLEQNGKDTAALTEEYNLLVAEINKKYDLQDEQNRQIAREQLLENLDEQLLTIENYAVQAERNLERLYAVKSIGLEDDSTSIMPSFKSEDNIAPIQLEIEKTLELQAIRAAAFDEQMAQIQAVLDAEKEKDTLTAEQEAELIAQYNALQNEKLNITADTNVQLAALNQQLIKQQQADNRQLAKNITSTFTTALSSVQSILSAVQSNIDTSNKEGFEKSKKLQIASATIGMLVGITNAVSGLFTTKSGPWDIALAAIQAAAIATTGGIQIAQIKKQTYEGGSSTGNLNPPSINTAALMSSPINYTTEIQGANAMEDVADTRVYVVESDITDTAKKVQIAEDESTY